MAGEKGATARAVETLTDRNERADNDDSSPMLPPSADRIPLASVTEVAYAQGIARGRELERAELLRILAERRDEIDATWQTIPRPSYEERVAARVAEMERAGGPARTGPQIIAEARWSWRQEVAS